MKKQSMMSSRPNPTTVSPITAPERKAICRPSLSDRSAPAAVRLLASVAVFMPNQPASPENNPPERKANGTHRLCTPKPRAIHNRSAQMARNAQPTTLYCCFRYASAPVRT